MGHIMANSLLHHTKFLAGKAQKKQLVTFQEFADEFEIKTIRSTTTPLKKVLKWTDSKKLPPLSALVVTPERAEEGYVEKDEEVQQAIQSVFDYPWKNIFLNLPDD
jgi:hypothetical protein